MVHGSARSPWTLVPVVGFVALYVAADAVHPIPLWGAGVYALVSVVTFVAYALDKAAARAHRRRISERMLLLLGLLCGWPGAVIAQQFLRHKTQKRSFRVRFWVTVAVNAGVFVVLAVVVR